MIKGSASRWNEESTLEFSMPYNSQNFIKYMELLKTESKTFETKNHTYNYVLQKHTIPTKILKGVPEQTVET